MKAVVFLGTPHGGSSLASFAKTLGNIANLALKIPGPQNPVGTFNTTLFKDLKEQSRDLENLREDFNRNAKSLQILTVYETEKHPLTNPPYVFAVELLPEGPMKFYYYWWHGSSIPGHF